MDEKIEDLYKKYQELSVVIKNKTEEKDKVLSNLLKSKVGKLYFNLNDEQKKLFEDIYRDADFSRYIYLRDDIKEYKERLSSLSIDIITHEDFPFKSEEATIYISDGIDIYDAITDASTKDLDENTKEVIKDIINGYSNFKSWLTISDIPLIKVIYEKLKKNNEYYADNNANITIMEDNIFNQVRRIHELDKRHSTYKENRRSFIKKLKESIASSELEIKNSDSGFKYLLLYSIESVKYEVSLLEGKRVTTILKEIEKSDMSEAEKDYKKDALVEAYYNLTNFDFRKQSEEYFDNDNDICYATFETANPEINKRLIKMRQG